MPKPTPPITAIVIFRNERRRLADCLEHLAWCDELICIDMASTDGSRAIARQHADRLFRVDPHPIAEPTRVVAAGLARHDWILLVDPDEIIPSALADRLRHTIAQDLDLAGARLPMRFYFKDRPLTGTVWGTAVHKRMLVHRERCALLPYCNRITELKPGQRDTAIPHATGEVVRHYWSDSYRDLIRKHFWRYPRPEARSRVADGERFTLRLGITHPLREGRKCFKDFDGWRLGPRGWALSAIYFGYVLLSTWLMLGVRPGKDSAQAAPTLPELTELPAGRTGRERDSGDKTALPTAA